MFKYSKIPNLDSFIFDLKKQNIQEVILTPSIKLHGTNASIELNQNNELKTYSREREISIGSDNYGFAAFIVANQDSFKESLINLKKHVARNANIKHSGLISNLIVYGEWIGSGIQNRVAISQLKERYFVIFDIAYVINEELYYISNEELNLYSIAFKFPNTLYKMDLKEFTFKLRPFSDLSIALFKERANTMIHFVENSDPFAKKHFNLDGIGEGLVWTSNLVTKLVNDTEFTYPIANLKVKTKGEKHSKSKVIKIKTEANPEELEQLSKLANELTPNWRLEQFLKEVFLDKETNQIVKQPKLIGSYLKAVNQDILAEEAVKIAESGLEWKKITGKVTSIAKDYYFNYDVNLF